VPNRAKEEVNMAKKKAPNKKPKKKETGEHMIDAMMAVAPRKSTDIADIYPPFVYHEVGRPLKFKPDELLTEFVKYIEWAKDHPIENVYQTSGTSYTGDSYGNTNKNLKPRLISIGGFLVFIGQTESWWKNLEEGKRGEEFLKVKEKIKNYCESYQKEMAAAGIFKENIISRLLGLKDKQEVENKGEGWKIIVNSEEEKKMVEGLKELDI
jgi:hypothetical protein